MDVPEKCNGCSDTGQWKRGVCQYWHNFYSEPRRMARCNDRGPYLSLEQSDPARLGHAGDRERSES